MLARPLSACYAMVAVAILSVVPLTLSLLAEPTPDPISVNSTVPLTPPAEPTPAPPVNPKTDEPKPSLVLAIDGPTEIEPGRMLTLRVSGITTTAAIDGPLPGVSWLMYPLTEDQRIERNGHAIHATWPGPCHVWFVASVNNPDPTQKPLTAMKLVKVGEPVVPEPDVPPKPPGPKPSPVPTGVSEKVAALAQLVSTDDKAAEAALLAECFERIAKQVESGDVADTASAVTKATRDMTSQTLVSFGTANALAWKPCLDGIESLVKETAKAGPVNHVAVWREISRGLTK